MLLVFCIALGINCVVSVLMMADNVDMVENALPANGVS
jgi:hypothetical protein